MLIKQLKSLNLMKYDEALKHLQIVMPDLIRHPECLDYTGFRLSPE